MNLKSAKTITVILLIGAILAFIYGIGPALKADKARAHDPEGIEIELVGIRPEISDAYMIYMNYSIENNTKEELEYLTAVAVVHDQSGKELGNLQLRFGGSGNNSLHLGKESTEQEVYLESRSPDAFFATLFQSTPGDLQITYEITAAQWADGYYYYTR